MKFRLIPKLTAVILTLILCIKFYSKWSKIKTIKTKK